MDNFDWRTKTVKLAPVSLGLAMGLVGLILAAGVALAGEVNLYSYRQPFLIQPLLQAFTAETGTQVNVVYAKTGMLERLKAEGRNSPADAVLTADIGRLADLVDAELVRPVHSKILNANIPANLRHPDGYWFGLTTRARVIFASKERVKPGEITTYEQLADPKWRGRICTRSGAHVYNIALIASMIAAHGEVEAEAWLKGVKANLARKPQGNDRAQVRAIKEGVCDLAIVNTYYMGKMLQNAEQRPWAEAAYIIFPNQQGRGTHINVSGAAVTKSAKHFDAAVRLIEFLSSAKAQRIYAAQNFEFPVLAGVPLNPIVESWGPFKADTTNLAEIASHRRMAMKLVDRVGFDL